MPYSGAFAMACRSLSRRSASLSGGAGEVRLGTGSPNSAKYFSRPDGATVHSPHGCRASPRRTASASRLEWELAAGELAPASGARDGWEDHLPAAGPGGSSEGLQTAAVWDFVWDFARACGE
jgi:hypothetical protein